MQKVEVRKDVSERIQRTYDIANRLDEQIRTNKNNIQEIDQREKNLQERLEALRDTPILSTHTCHSENREVINFQNYRRNPMEFLERMEEFIERYRETRWDRIREMLDETFRNTRDNWWIAVRPEITNLNEFKRQFKEKYWSETAQNKVRMDIFYGKYDACKGQSPTSYILRKICLARKLIPPIPEECLVRQLAGHYRYGICLLYSSRCV